MTSHWSLTATLPIVIGGLVVWSVSAWLAWSNWNRNARRKSILCLESLRLLLITLLMFTLLRPELVRLIQRTETPEVAILWDASGSMATRDIIRSNVITSRSDWLKTERDKEFWKPLEKTSKVSVDPFAGMSTNDTNSASIPATDLGLALEQTLRRQKNLKAVLMLTDGDWNIGKSPLGIATRYREENIPIYTVAVGRETPIPDIDLISVTAPSYGLFGEQISIPFKIRSFLPREVKTTISLLDGTRVETKKEITIPAQGEMQDAILWFPRNVGDTTLTLQLPVEPDEGLPENNHQTFRMNVKIETLKVLVIDSLPRWEYRYLRNALARDPGVEMHSLLFHPGLGPGGGRNYLPAFPSGKEALSRYDVIFLGDVGVGDNELTEKDLESIKALVGQQSSGLVFLPGRRGRQLTLAHGAMEELLPVILDETKPEGIGLQNESTLTLSSLGKHHLLTRFEADEARNDEIWKQLPGFFWSAAVSKSRPGSEVLAVHSSLRNASGRFPLLVTRSFGSGKVLFMGTDSAWRWRRGVEDLYHYRFWSQVVRWMAHQRHLAEKQGIRLSFTPEVPVVGDTVYLQATVFDPSGFPLENGRVTGSVLSPSGRSEKLEFSPVEGGWGVFKSSFTPGDGGKFRLRITAEGDERQLETTLLVDRPVIEKVGNPINQGILKEISALTKGQNGTIESLSSLIENIKILPEPQPIERRLRLWSSPWWAGFLLFLLGIYWTGRKLAGMI